MPDIISMPDELYRVVLAKFNPVYLNTSSGPSNFNPIQSMSGPSAVFWQPEFTFAVADKDTFLLYRRFVMKLRGGKTLARLYDPTMTDDVFSAQPRGAGGSGSAVNVSADADAGAETVTLKNLLTSRAIALMAGDMLGIGENLFIVEDDCPSDSGGEATVSIQPPLRHGIAEDDSVNLVKPTGLFRLVSGGQDLSMDLNQVGQAFTLVFQEVPDFDA
jgi:hypothetical protein